MSLILDALSRSEHDRSEPGDLPGLNARHGPEPVAAANSQRWSLLALLFALPLLLVLAWMQFAEEDDKAGPASPAPGVSNSSPAVVTKPARPAPTEPPSTVKHIPAPVQTRMPAERPVPPQKAAVARARVIEPVAARPEPHTETAVTPEIASLYAAQDRRDERAMEPEVTPVPDSREPLAATGAVPATRKPEPEPLDLEAIAQAAERELGEKAVSEHAVPLIADLSQRQKDAIPSVFYSAHHWNGSSANSWVVLNGNKVRQGGAAGKGVQLDEILEDSVVLEYQGTRFRLRSLNSWVNL